MKKRLITLTSYRDAPNHAARGQADIYAVGAYIDLDWGWPILKWLQPFAEDGTVIKHTFPPAVFVEKYTDFLAKRRRQLIELVLDLDPARKLVLCCRCNSAQVRYSDVMCHTTIIGWELQRIFGGEQVSIAYLDGRFPFRCGPIDSNWRKQRCQTIPGKPIPMGRGKPIPHYLPF